MGSIDCFYRHSKVVLDIVGFFFILSFICGLFLQFFFFLISLLEIMQYFLLLLFYMPFKNGLLYC